MTRLTIDASILVYAVETGDPRQNAALAIIAGAARAGGLITLQALGEFFFATTRKRKLEAEAAIHQVSCWSTAFGTPIAGSPAALSEAMAAAAARRFSFWDAMLLASAAQAGCTAMISEDMAPGAQLGPIRVIPAFAGADVSAEARALLG